MNIWFREMQVNSPPRCKLKQTETVQQLFSLYLSIGMIRTTVLSRLDNFYIVIFTFIWFHCKKIALPKDITLQVRHLYLFVRCVLRINCAGLHLIQISLSLLQQKLDLLNEFTLGIVGMVDIIFQSNKTKAYIMD